MAKRIVAKTGQYQKDGQTKGEYTKLGVMLNNDNGDYMLLDPSVSLAGLLLKQNALAAKTGGKQRDMVMISIFEDDNNQQQNNGGQQQQQQQQQGGYQQQAPQQQNNQQQQAPQQQSGYGYQGG
ncbi:hypothetical protein [Pseudoalteromonas sp.]|uniref:hypothetical protein n=1 Tax=Pseudoalteromonas sp. TaxID=53249 RepID=UPI0025810C89|nr:hypothetical protein [Pseudoalteromonas sp.]